MLSLLLVCLISTVAVNCQNCRFRSELWGQWTKSFDFGYVIVHVDLISGFVVRVGSQEISRFACYKLYYNNIYILRASYKVPGTLKRKYYFECWKFEILSFNIFLIHDLSEIRHFGREWLNSDREVHDEEYVPSFDSVCVRNATNEPYSIMYRRGVTSNKFDVPCPPSLVGHYAPEFECLESDVNFCNKDNNGMLAMTKCSGIADAMFETAGPLTCVGHKYMCPYVHATIYHLDRVDCLVFREDALEGGVLEATIYFGDCTMVGRSQVNFPLSWKLINRCPNDNPPIVNRTRHCVHDAVRKLKSTNSADTISSKPWPSRLLVVELSALLFICKSRFL